MIKVLHIFDLIRSLLSILNSGFIIEIAVSVSLSNKAIYLSIIKMVYYFIWNNDMYSECQPNKNLTTVFYMFCIT